MKGAKRSPEALACILEAIGRGVPFCDACRLAGVSPQSGCDWRREDPGFDDAVRRARAQRLLSLWMRLEASGRDWRKFALMISLLDPRTKRIPAGTSGLLLAGRTNSPDRVQRRVGIDPAAVNLKTGK